MHLYKRYVFITIIFITTFTLSSCLTYSAKQIVAKNIFPKLDLNNDKSISYAEFRVVTSKDQEDIKYAREKALKKGVTVNEYMRSEFDRADINKDGKITFREFLKNIGKTEN